MGKKYFYEIIFIFLVLSSTTGIMEVDGYECNKMLERLRTWNIVVVKLSPVAVLLRGRNATSSCAKMQSGLNNFELSSECTGEKTLERFNKALLDTTNQVEDLCGEKGSLLKFEECFIEHRNHGEIRECANIEMEYPKHIGLIESVCCVFKKADECFESAGISECLCDTVETMVKWILSREEICGKYECNYKVKKKSLTTVKHNGKNEYKTPSPVDGDGVDRDDVDRDDVDKDNIGNIRYDAYGHRIQVHNNRNPITNNEDLNTNDKNTEKISNDHKDINKNLNDINKNPKNINKNPKDINKNTESVSKNPEGIDKNPKNFNENPKNFNENPEDISKNIKDFTKNTEGINKNTEGINKKPEGIDKNPKNFNENPEDISKNLKDINKNTDGINKNTEGINRKPEGIDKNPKYFNENTKDINKNPEGIDKNPKNFNDNPNNINKNPKNINKNTKNNYKDTNELIGDNTSDKDYGNTYRAGHSQEGRRSKIVKDQGKLTGDERSNTICKNYRECYHKYNVNEFEFPHEFQLAALAPLYGECYSIHCQRLQKSVVKEIKALNKCIAEGSLLQKDLTILLAEQTKLKTHCAPGGRYNVFADCIKHSDRSDFDQCDEDFRKQYLSENEPYEKRKKEFCIKKHEVSQCFLDSLPDCEEALMRIVIPKITNDFDCGGKKFQGQVKELSDKYRHSHELGEILTCTDHGVRNVTSHWLQTAAVILLTVLYFNNIFNL